MEDLFQTLVYRSVSIVMGKDGASLGKGALFVALPVTRFLDDSVERKVKHHRDCAV